MEGLRVAAQVGVMGLGQAPVGPLDRTGDGAKLQAQQLQGLQAAGIQAGATGWLTPCPHAFACASPRALARARARAWGWSSRASGIRPGA